jgi:hypothetical protein
MLLSLTACSGEPWTLSRSPDAITLRWYSDASDEARARGAAGAYCTQAGRSVELGAIQRDGSAVIANYRCV